MLDLSSLNENQKSAVEWEAGPLIVLAGPGSGKTRVLAYRLARLIIESPNRFFKVLALTFTNKAAAEMRERVAALLPEVSDRAVLTTFHSFAADIVRQHGHHRGLRADFTMMVEESDRHSLLDEAIERSTLQRPSGELSSERLLPLINRMIENDIRPENASAALEKSYPDDAVMFGSIYSCYRSLMIERNALDFVGLISEALIILETKPGVRTQLQKTFPHISIDEFQDTNKTQYKILCCIINPETKNLFAVADDDQIIYQWNGASPDRLRALEKDYGASVIQLPDNYRCPSEVVELANKLISHNFERTQGKLALRTDRIRSAKNAVEVKSFGSFADECAWIATSIASRSDEEKLQCAVLARTKKALEGVIGALNSQGIYGYLGARKAEFESVPLQWIHSALRLANARSSRECLRKLSKTFFSLEGIDLDVADIVAQAGTHEGDFLRTWISVALSRDSLEPSTRALINGPMRALADRLDFWGFVSAALVWLDALPDSAPQTEAFDDYPEERATWNSLVAEISDQYGRSEVTLHLLLQEMDLRSKSPAAPKGAIPCFTIHASKGLEFGHVYLVAMVEDQLPSWAAVKRGPDSKEMQEERRNCFVAITRTQNSLTLTFSDQMQGWRKQPSRFLQEMGLLV